MDDVDLERHVADTMIGLYVEVGRLANAAVAASIRAQAEPYAASLRTWRTARPTMREVLLVLVAVDRLRDRIRDAGPSATGGGRGAACLS